MATDEFLASVQKSYDVRGESIVLGAGMLGGQVIPGAVVRVPLSTLNRHGLIAGATGTGKTKSLQLLAEGAASKGVAVLMMDIKGDLSGIAAPGTESDKIRARHALLGLSWKAEGFPCELMSISAAKGVRLRATVSEFGPVLFAKVLGLNDTQSGVVSLVFKYADDNLLPLLDLKDFKKVLQYCTNEGKEEIKSLYGAISTATASTILRKIIEIEEQGADLFFGELSFDVEDLLRLDEYGRGYVHTVRLTDLQDKPKLFSTFMLCLLAEIYQRFPEEGDADQPKLVVFIDEAHLVFKEAGKALLDQLESIIKLIRSKGVGVIFCTQNPADIPAAVLGQLGLKIQHALRAFTAADRKGIRMAAENYPDSTFYKVNSLLTELGIGEALVTALSENGTPTLLVHTSMCAPASRMDILSEAEQDALLERSALVRKYNEQVDRESAYELLMAKIGTNREDDKQDPMKKKAAKKTKQGSGESVLEEALNSSVGRQVARTVTQVLTRSLLGVLGLGGRRR